MSEVNGQDKSNETVSAGIKRGCCDRLGCHGKAEFKPVIQLRAAEDLPAIEMFPGIVCCKEHATEEIGKDFISLDEQREILDTVFKLQTKGLEIDWDWSGVVWVRIN